MRDRTAESMSERDDLRHERERDNERERERARERESTAERTEERERPRETDSKEWSGRDGQRLRSEDSIEAPAKLMVCVYVWPAQDGRT